MQDRGATKSSSDDSDREQARKVYESRRGVRVQAPLVLFYTVSSSLLFFPAGFGLFFWLYPYHVASAFVSLGTVVFFALILQTIMIRKTDRADFPLSSPRSSRKG